MLSAKAMTNIGAHRVYLINFVKALEKHFPLLAARLEDCTVHAKNI